MHSCGERERAGPGCGADRQLLPPPGAGARSTLCLHTHLLTHTHNMHNRKTRNARQQDADAAGLVPSLTVFHGLRAPPISVEAYLVRIAKYARCSPACFVQALALVLRLARRDAAHRVTGLNVHRLVLTGVLLSAKFLDDHYYNNAFYAKVGGVSTAELNRLEVEMLRLLGFRLLVPREELEQLLRDARSGCLAGQAAARWRCGRKRRSAAPAEGAAGVAAVGAAVGGAVGVTAGVAGVPAQCDAGARRASVEAPAPRRFGRVVA